MITEKQAKRVNKELGVEFIKELEGRSAEDLKSLIVGADGAIKTASDELEANPKYVALKESLKDAGAGLASVKKRQNAIVMYCLHLLEEGGK